MTDTTRAVIAEGAGGPEVLRVVETARPDPGPGQLLIEVHAAGVNRPDVMQRQGNYPPPPGASDVFGLELAGVVAALGPDVTGFEIGDRVMGLVHSGAYADWAVLDAPIAIPVPEGLSMAEAGAVPETFFTVWSNVFERGGLQAGERFLVHGGSSGIGTTAIQLASAFGARVFATAGSADKCAACESLGAERAINYREEDFVEILRGEGGAHLILDMVGGDYIPRDVKALADEGRLVQIAFLQGPKVELNFAQVMMRRLTITGSTLRPQSDLAKGRIAEALRAQVWPLLDAGRVAPVMDSDFPLADASKAHDRMESSGHIGKIVLKVA